MNENDVQETAVVPLPPRTAMPPIPIQHQIDEAKVLIASGFLPAHITNPAQAVAIMQRGRELGLPTMEALSSLYVVHGKVTCDSKTMLALCLRSGVIERLDIKEATDDHCTLVVQRRGGTPQEFTFTMDDAAALGLANKAQYKSQPRVMLRWRCVGEALRIVAPDALAGLYTHEELGAPVRVEDGQIELDSKALVQGVQHQQAEALADELGAAFDAGMPAEPNAPAAATSGGVVCPECGGETWNNREKREQDKAAYEAGTRKSKPRPAYGCKDKECKGVIWSAREAEILCWMAAAKANGDTDGRRALMDYFGEIGVDASKWSKCGDAKLGKVAAWVAAYNPAQAKAEPAEQVEPIEAVDLGMSVADRNAIIDEICDFMEDDNTGDYERDAFKDAWTKMKLTDWSKDADDEQMNKLLGTVRDLIAKRQEK